MKEGYLKRQAAEGDRRKVLLLCTDKAMPVIRRGRALQQSFFEQLFTGTKEETKKQFLEIIALMGKNLDSMLEGED